MFLELLKKRRSVRQYTDQAVETEKVDLLIESALRSPSSRSLNPWEFIVVTKPETIVLLSNTKPHGANFLKQSPLVIVVIADPNTCDVWIEDASIATYNLHLAATDLGLGSCWVQIRLRQFDQQKSAADRVKEILSIPDHMEVLSFVGVGYPAKEKSGHTKSSLDYSKIYQEQYGQF